MFESLSLGLWRKYGLLMIERVTTHRRRPWRDAGVQALLLFLLLAVLFPSVFMRGQYISPADILYASPPWNAYRPAEFERPQNPIMSDIVTLFYPMYWETERSFERGEWPLWNRLELGGMPLLANYETAIFYPPRLLYTIFDIPLAMTLHVLLKLWLCGMTAFVCGRGLQLSISASRFFSIGWMLGTYNVMFAPWCLPDVSAWIPILFLGVHAIAEGRYRYGLIVGTIGATLMMFAGHPELAFGAAAGIGVYFLVRLIAPWRGAGHAVRAVGACCALWFVALLVTSVQVVPFLEYVAHSSESHRLHVVGTAWFTPGNLVAYWAPRFYGLRADYNYWGNPGTQDYSMLYPGIAVWIGIAALLMVRRAVTRPLTLALAVASSVQLALAFQVPGIAWLTELPILHTMAPYWFAVFPIFALPLLGAIGLDHWTTERPPLRSLWQGIWLPVAAIVVVIGVLRFYRSFLEVLGTLDYVRVQVAVAAVLLVVTTGVLVMSCARRRHALALPALTVLLGADLLFAARGINPTMPPEDVYPRTALTDYLRELPEPSRVGIAQAQIVSGIMAPYDIEEWLGYDGLYPARVLDFQTTLGRDVWEAMEPACAIQYYLHDPAMPPQFPLDDPGRFTRVHTADGIEVYRNNEALPHAFFSASVATVASEEALFERMSTPGFQPEQTALVLEPEWPGGDTSTANGAPRGTAVVEERRGTYVRVRTDSESQQVLTLADAYYPGWRVMIDGEAAPLFPVFHAFRGAIVPAGEHTIEYHYRPLSFCLPLAVSSVTLVALGVLGTAWLRRNRGEFDSPAAV